MDYYRSSQWSAQVVNGAIFWWHSVLEFSDTYGFKVAANAALSPKAKSMLHIKEWAFIVFINSTKSFIMKSILSLALFVASAFAQGAVIGYPPQGLSVSPGSNLVVQVERPVSFWHAIMPVPQLMLVFTGYIDGFCGSCCRHWHTVMPRNAVH